MKNNEKKNEKIPWNATINVKQLLSIKNFSIKEIEIKTKNFQFKYLKQKKSFNTMSSKKKIDELVAKAKTYGYSGVSRNEKTLNAWIRNAEYLYESSVKYIGWNITDKNIQHKTELRKI